MQKKPTFLHHAATKKKHGTSRRPAARDNRPNNIFGYKEVAAEQSYISSERLLRRAAGKRLATTSADWWIDATHPRNVYEP